MNLTIEAIAACHKQMEAVVDRLGLAIDGKGRVTVPQTGELVCTFLFEAVYGQSLIQVHSREHCHLAQALREGVAKLRLGPVTFTCDVATTDAAWLNDLKCNSKPL